jgi:DNA-binding LacI/PurR family transcriptional regulator
MTVSNAYSRPDQLSSTLRQQILAAARELGYSGPDLKARALTRGTSGAIGIVLCGSLRWTFTDPVAAGFLGAVAAEFESTGQAITLLGGSTDLDDAAARNVAVDGAIITSRVAPAVAPLTERRVPLVYVDESPAKGSSSVTVDDAGGASLASQHLLDLGHRRIAVLTPAVPGPPTMGPDTSTSPGSSIYVAAERVKGWLAPLHEQGIEPVVALYDLDTGYQAAYELLSGPVRPTGVVCFSDVTVGAVLGAAHDLGIAVPDQLSVVGFDDAPGAAAMRPALTTIRQDIQAKGHAAAVELRRVLDSRQTGAAFRARHVVLPTTLVVRGTTAPPPIR